MSNSSDHLFKPGSVKANKHLGQNFLTSLGIRHKMIEACDLSNTETILEIGPGLGILTKPLSEQTAHVIAIEKDTRLARKLKAELDPKRVTVIHEDILRYDFSNIPVGTKVVGNLPYNISTPIIERLIQHKHLFHAAYLTLQLEYGQRLTAPPGSKTYGAFSCFVQYHAQTRLHFKIKNTAFHPVPKVQSCFLSLIFPPNPQYHPTDEDLLFRIIHNAFQQRRKKLINTLEGLGDKERIKETLTLCGISPDIRAEMLSIEDFIRLADQWAMHK